MSNKFHQLKLKKMTNQYFELPHLNCDLIVIDDLPYNIYVQQLQMPFEPFAENDFYGVILHNQPSAQMATFIDNISSEILTSPIVEFTGTRPTRPR